LLEGFVRSATIELTMTFVRFRTPLEVPLMKNCLICDPVGLGGADTPATHIVVFVG
jgi:hypothetical protein